MSSIQPPRTATWLLIKLGGGSIESIAGDLVEQLLHGRSRAWYWRQVLGVIASHGWRTLKRHAILNDGGPAMLKLAATFLILSMFIALSTLVLFDGSIDPFDWTAAGGILCAVNLVLLALRGIWRSYPRVVESLYWPTLTAAGLLGLSGAATILDTLRSGRERGEMDVYFLGVGAFIVLVCLLTAFTLRPRRLSS